jgi:multiple sugar transport system substrate-binding protein
LDLSRRNFLLGSLGGAALLGLNACSSNHSDDAGGGSTRSGSTQSAGAKAGGGKVTGTLDFGVWASVSERKGFQRAIDTFEAANPGAKVKLKVSAYDGFFSGIDRGIQAGSAPDLFRVDYTTIGQYSKNDLLLDVTPYFTSDEVSAFLPAFWDAVKHQGVPYGVPHQTDTTCIVYDTDAFKAAGITSVPSKLEDAWTWEEFSAVAAKLRQSLPDNKFPFAYDWTQAGAFRWLSWLYQAGGTLLDGSQTKCVLPSDAGTKALDFTKSFFDKKWVPAANSIKTKTYSDNFFLSKTVPMSFVGDFLVPELADTKTGYRGNWSATFMPQDKGTASDLGGNAIVARKDVKNPDLAAAFLKHLVSEDAMKYFCEQSVELPTLKSLASAKLDYAFRPDVLAICAQQATTVNDTIIKECTVAGFAEINVALQDELESAFRASGGQSTATTLKNLAAKVNTAVGG